MDRQIMSGIETISAASSIQPTAAPRSQDSQQAKPTAEDSGAQPGGSASVYNTVQSASNSTIRGVSVSVVV